MDREPKPPQNCWEILKCGREAGGSNVVDSGVCLAATDASVDGFNRGKNGGRICWHVAGTFCKDNIKGTFAANAFSCFACSVFLRIQKEEGKSFIIRKPE